VSNQDTSQLERLEHRIERLTSVVIIQSVLLAAVVLINVLELAPYVALLLLIALPVLVFYRKELPVAARWLGRLIQRLRGTSGPLPNPSEEQST
jgi:hypothetical protein